MFNSDISPRWELKRQYENLRRPFSVTKDVPYTDVWNFPPVLYYPGKHPCEKPAALLEHIINASSKPKYTVADFFMGSGSTVKAAIQLRRQAIGVELETDRFLQTKKEIENLITQINNEGMIFDEALPFYQKMAYPIIQTLENK